MERPLTQNIRPGEDPLDLAAYRKAGGYRSVSKALGQMQPQEVTEEVKKSGLRGRGGGGFGTGLKWSFVPMGDDAPAQKYLVVNGDEMEPGSFKDRHLLEGDPHQMIEGAIVASYAIGARTAYIFLRHAFRLAEQRLRRALGEACDAGLVGKNILGSGFNLDIHIHVSSGRYMCGEETGLLNALEGRRATPRSKPPYPQSSGLWGKPTVVNNVESLCNVPHIVNNGAQWFQSLGLTDEAGTKLYGVSGKAKRPGLWELPMGTSAREIIEEHAGGMRDGLKLAGFIPGGASTEFVLPEHLDTPMDFGHMEQVGSRLGTGTITLLDDHNCPVALLHNLQKFFAQESCGWCTPCREGLRWVEHTLAAIENGHGELGDLELLEQQARLLGPGHTFCALAPGAAEPLASGVRLYRDVFERHITLGRCPYRS